MPTSFTTVTGNAGKKSTQTLKLTPRKLPFSLTLNFLSRNFKDTF